MTDTTGFIKQKVYRVKFYINSHNQGEKPDYISDNEFDAMNLTGEIIERDVLALYFEEAIEIAKRTMNENRMGTGIEWEVVFCEEISRPENSNFLPENKNI